MPDEGSEESRADEGRGLVRVHEPVLLRESLEILDLRPGMVVVDGTVGAGGHGAAFATEVGASGLLVGLDRDTEILPFADRALRAVGDGCRFRLHHGSFTEIGRVLADEGLDGCDRVFLDLGVSSLQLDTASRGFSLMLDGPLDMRLDASAPVTASEWLRRVSSSDLERALRDYGEERFARRIVRAIDRERKRRPITRTGQLKDVVARAVPGRGRSRIHPATRTFQAIRIAVNDELGVLQRGLEHALECLAPDGRLAAIAFHSLEDRIVKRFVRERMQRLLKKPVRAGVVEIERNPRARSARLRCGVKVAS